jgi:hypothetical protein
MPNPFSGSTLLGFEGVGKDSRLLVYDLPGRLLQSLDLPAGSGQVSVGEGLPQGVYLARLEQEGRVVRTVRLVKQ